MNRGMLQTSPVQQMVTGNPYWQWNPSAIPPPPSLPLPPTTALPFYASASIMQLPYQKPPSLLVSSSAWNDNQEFTGSWSQLLLGGPISEDENHGNMINTKKMENFVHQVLFPSSNTHMTQVKSEVLSGGCVYSHHQDYQNQELQTTAFSSQQISHLASSPTASCTSYKSSVLEFSNSRPKKQHNSSDRSPECNSSGTGSAVKKAKVQATSTGQSSFKARKEKLGDRVTALHQLVSPFGKTDTASVLLEVIGYIRFLQGQIAALSSPYMDTASGNFRHQVKDERKSCGFPEDLGQLVNESCSKRKTTKEKKVAVELKKDLKSRGLCLVPVSCILNVGTENEAGFSPAAAAGGFQLDG